MVAGELILSTQCTLFVHVRRNFPQAESCGLIMCKLVRLRRVAMYITACIIVEKKFLFCHVQIPVTSMSSGHYCEGQQNPARHKV